MKQSHKTLLLWVLLIMMFLAIWQFLSPNQSPATSVAWSEFRAQVIADREKEPHVESVSIKNGEYTFWVKDPKQQSKAKRMALGPDKPDESTTDIVPAQNGKPKANHAGEFDPLKPVFGTTRGRT